LYVYVFDVYICTYINLTMWWQSWIFSRHYHFSHMILYLMFKKSYYYPCWKQLCSLILVKPW